jgi:hypothetical protein
VRADESRPAGNQCAHVVFLPWEIGTDGIGIQTTGSEAIVLPATRSL